MFNRTFHPLSKFYYGYYDTLGSISFIFYIIVRRIKFTSFAIKTELADISGCVNMESLTTYISHDETTDTDMNEMMNATDTYPGLPESVFGSKDIVMLIIQYTFAALGIPGNLLALAVLFGSKSLRSKPINRFLMHQAFIDLLSCSCTIFEEKLKDVPGLSGQPVICHLFESKVAGGVLYYASTYNMVFLSIERYQAIIHPLQYNPEKVLRRLPFMFLGTWLICMVALCIIPVTTVVKHGICLPGWLMLTTPIVMEYYTPHCLVVSFVVLISIMIFCYSRIYLAMRTSLKLSAPASDRSKSVQQASGDKSAAVHKSRLAQVNIPQTCIIFASLTSLCWLTNVSALVMYIAGYYKNLANDHVVIGIHFLVANALLNPYVSIIRYDAFKLQLKVLFFRKTSSAAPIVYKK